MCAAQANGGGATATVCSAMYSTSTPLKSVLLIMRKDMATSNQLADTICFTCWVQVQIIPSIELFVLLQARRGTGTMREWIRFTDSNWLNVVAADNLTVSSLTGDVVQVEASRREPSLSSKKPSAKLIFFFFLGMERFESRRPPDGLRITGPGRDACRLIINRSWCFCRRRSKVATHSAPKQAHCFPPSPAKCSSPRMPSPMALPLR
mmetsp:Transcript_108332/g.288268  ORF Transcript_108332/g.288268 Transcript_108332/m.288268 type:complete len:207 (+) Transcript_108332:1353-1973(+)